MDPSRSRMAATLASLAFVWHTTRIAVASIGGERAQCWSASVSRVVSSGVAVENVPDKASKACAHLRSSDVHLLTTYYLLLTHLLLTTDYLLLTTYYLLRTTYYLLLAPCSLLLASYSLRERVCRQ